MSFKPGTRLNMRYPVFGICLLTVALALVACSDSTGSELESIELEMQTPVIDTEDVTIPEASRVERATATAHVASPTKELKPTESLPTTFPTPSPFPTLDTVRSTITEEVATENLLELLEENKGCELPCWWGIIPGQTYVESIESEFVPLGFDWNRDYETLNDNTPYQAYVDLTTENGVVQSIEVRGGASEHTYDQNLAWKPYAIPNVLERLGRPEQVYVYRPFRFDPGGMQAYRLFLYYPDLGIEIDYLGKSSLIEASPEIARACPSIVETDEINLFLYTPGSAIDYLERTLPSYTIPFVPEGENPHDAVSWEQVTDSSIDDFYYMLLNNTEGEVCFDFKTNRPVK